MRIAIAFDSYKGCVDGYTASRYVARILRLRHSVDAVALPLADGGEGTAAALRHLLGGREYFIDTVDASGRPVRAPFMLLSDATAALDVASCYGLGNAELTGANRVMTASSYGVGVMLRHISRRYSPRRILLGLGGSAGCDGGTGMLQALGARFCGDTNLHSRLSGADLRHIASVDVSKLEPLPPLTLLRDVDAPLTGEEGAACRFAPQKGAAAEQVQELEAGMERWWRVLTDALPAMQSLSPSQPGMGAAGGISAAAMAYSAAACRGAEYVISLIDPMLEGAEMAVTGEGRSDVSTLQGKAPYALLRATSRRGIPLSLLSGALALPPKQWIRAGFHYAEAISPSPYTLHDMLPRVTLSRLTEATLRRIRLH